MEVEDVVVVVFVLRLMKIELPWTSRMPMPALNKFIGWPPNARILHIQSIQRNTHTFGQMQIDRARGTDANQKICLSDTRHINDDNDDANFGKSKQENCMTTQNVAQISGAWHSIGK